jgi:hypothetical protein
MAQRGRAARQSNDNLRLTRQIRKDETELQKLIVTDLRAYLPEGVWFGCSLSGLRLPMHAAVEAKRCGMEKGAPDLSVAFLSTDDTHTYYLELKTLDGQLRPEQAAFARWAGPAYFRVVRSFSQYRDIMSGWLEAHGMRFLTPAESIRKGRPVL